jgi:hypothetical protein
MATCGLDDVEQLEHHGGDAAEVAGAEFAFEEVLDVRRVDLVALRLRVQIGFVGANRMSTPASSQLFAVGGEGARVACRNPRSGRIAGG